MIDLSVNNYLGRRERKLTVKVKQLAKAPGFSNMMTLQDFDNMETAIRMITYINTHPNFPSTKKDPTMSLGRVEPWILRSNKIPTLKSKTKQRVPILKNSKIFANEHGTQTIKAEPEQNKPDEMNYYSMADSKAFNRVMSNIKQRSQSVIKGSGNPDVQITIPTKAETSFRDRARLR